MNIYIRRRCCSKIKRRRGKNFSCSRTVTSIWTNSKTRRTMSRKPRSTKTSPRNHEYTNFYRCETKKLWCNGWKFYWISSWITRRNYWASSTKNDSRTKTRITHSNSINSTSANFPRRCCT